MLRTTRLIGTALGILLGVTACQNDDLFPPQGSATRDPLFDRYVSVGNSITAGFQSGGIVDSTQLQSYAVLLSRQMATPFFVPLLNRPGCTPPIVAVFASPRTYLDGAPAGACALRKAQSVPPPFINNVAVPGAYAYSVLDNLNPTQSHPNPLTTFFLGGYTQMGMLKKIDPTFVTVWIGNNDVLGAATSGTNGGDSTLITDTTVFKVSYGAMLDTIATTSVRGGVLIGVANVTLIPFFSQGQIYLAVKAANPVLLASLTLGPNCAPSASGGKGDSVLVPFPFGLPKVDSASRGLPTTLTCTETQTVQPAELKKLVATVGSYNAFISAQAAARGYAYLDPNSLFTALPAGSIPPFPTFSGAAAVTAPFGNFFSRDGVHPTAASHKLVANALIQAINAKYSKSLLSIP
jgi:hypothetical protein